MSLPAHCIPCEGTISALSLENIKCFMQEIVDWNFIEKKPYRIQKTFSCSTFSKSLAFVNNVALLAEKEGHHPIITIRYAHVDIELYTHALQGLSLNDFVLAKKIDAIKLEECADETSSIAFLKHKVDAFVQERDWEQFHSPKNLTMNLSVEANELMEHFLWVSTEESWRHLEESRKAIEHELADILIGTLEFSLRCNIDLAKACCEKIEEIKEKYPKEKVKGKFHKYSYYKN